MYRVRSKLMDEIRVAEIRKKLNREENDDIEFLLDLIENQDWNIQESDYYELEDRVDELENENTNLTIELEELKIKLKELRKTTVSINLGDYI